MNQKNESDDLKNKRDELNTKIALTVKAACIETLRAAYEDAGISGLCESGRWDVALSAVKALDVQKLINLP